MRVVSGEHTGSLCSGGGASRLYGRQQGGVVRLQSQGLRERYTGVREEPSGHLHLALSVVALRTYRTRTL